MQMTKIESLFMPYGYRERAIRLKRFDRGSVEFADGGLCSERS